MQKKPFSTILILILFLSLFLIACQGSDQKKSKKDIRRTKPNSHVKQPGYLYGTVKETMNGGGYTYILLEFEGKKSWVAVPPMKVKAGDEVMLYPGKVMENFHSKSLNKTFRTIIFSQGAVSPSPNSKASEGSADMVIKAHSSASRIEKKDIKISPASGPDAITVEMAYQKADELNGKHVVLKAVVIKISKNILGKNWLHCQDGTGSKKDNNFDITVTTKASPSVGDRILIKGILHKDVDIGAGYFYPVLIEDAKITSLGK